VRIACAERLWSAAVARPVDTRIGSHQIVAPWSRGGESGEWEEEKRRGKRFGESDALGSRRVLTGALVEVFASSSEAYGHVTR
jgi:hypothetical protein